MSESLPNTPDLVKPPIFNKETQENKIKSLLGKLKEYFNWDKEPEYFDTYDLEVLASMIMPLKEYGVDVSAYEGEIAIISKKTMIRAIKLNIQDVEDHKHDLAYNKLVESIQTAESKGINIEEFKDQLPRLSSLVKQEKENLLSGM